MLSSLTKNMVRLNLAGSREAKLMKNRVRFYSTMNCLVLEDKSMQL